MSASSTTRALVAALAFATLGSSAFAEGDIYSRLAQMRQMQAASSGMVSRQQFMEMAGRAWDMKAQEAKSHDGSLSPERVRELESTLGRVLSAQARP